MYGTLLTGLLLRPSSSVRNPSNLVKRTSWTTDGVPALGPWVCTVLIVTLGKSETYKETIKGKSTILPYSIHKRILSILSHKVCTVLVPGTSGGQWPGTTPSGYGTVQYCTCLPCSYGITVRLFQLMNKGLDNGLGPAVSSPELLDTSSYNKQSRQRASRSLVPGHNHLYRTITVPLPRYRTPLLGRHATSSSY